MRDKYFYLEFSVHSPKRFEALRRLFSALKEEKNRIVRSWDSNDEEDRYDPTDEPNWHVLLDEQAVEWFADNFDNDAPRATVSPLMWKRKRNEISEY